MSIVLTCPGCGKQLRVKEEMAGKSARCPACRGPLVIPGGAAASATREAGDAEPDHGEPTRGPGPRPRRRGRKKARAAGAFTVEVFGITLTPLKIAALAGALAAAVFVIVGVTVLVRHVNGPDRAAPVAAEPVAERKDPYKEHSRGVEATVEYHDGEKALLCDDYDEAIRHFTRVMELFPDDTRAPSRRAIAYLGKGDTARAVADLTAVLKKDPRDYSALDSRSFVYVKAGQYRKAVEDINEALRVRPGDPDANLLRRRADACLRLKEYDQALADLNALIARQPTPDLYTARSEAYDGKGDHARAVADLAEAQKGGGGRAAGLMENRASAAAAERRYGKAVAYYSAAIDAEPKRAELYRKRGLALQQQKEYARAAEDFTKLLELDPKSAGDALFFRSEAHLKMKDNAKAVADLEQWAALQPTRPLPYGRLAWLWATCPDDAARDGAKAVEYATKACEMTGWKDPEQLQAMAAACAEQGKFADAVKWQKKALEQPGLARRPEAEPARARLRLYEEGKPYREAPEAG
jgi:tetratricopeptide (TPR) repeat protein